MDQSEAAMIKDSEPLSNDIRGLVEDTIDDSSCEAIKEPEGGVINMTYQQSDTRATENADLNVQENNQECQTHVAPPPPEVSRDNFKAESINEPDLEVTDETRRDPGLDKTVSSVLDIVCKNVTSQAGGLQDPIKSGILMPAVISPEEPSNLSSHNQTLPKCSNSELTSTVAAEPKTELKPANSVEEWSFVIDNSCQVQEQNVEHKVETTCSKKTLEETKNAKQLGGMVLEANETNQQESALVELSDPQIHFQPCEPQEIGDMQLKLNGQDAKGATTKTASLHSHMQHLQEDSNLPSANHNLQPMTDVELNNSAAVDSISCTSYVNHSETLLHDTEVELAKLQTLTSSTALLGSHSIYKLAYDDGETDQSEVDDQDLESRLQDYCEDVPCPRDVCSLVAPAIERPHRREEDDHPVERCEILVHEMDSASGAGSEDVELLPHRYESQGMLEQKHIYVNKLSLATELLRTKEALPYDGEFKMIVNGDEVCRTAPMSVLENFFGQMPPAMGDEVAAITHDGSGDRTVRSTGEEKISVRQKRTSAADSGVQSEESSDEVAEEAKENQQVSIAVLLNSDEEDIWTKDIGHKVNKQLQDASPSSTAESPAQGRKQRIPLAAVGNSSLNPCFCCAIM